MPAPSQENQRTCIWCMCVRVSISTLSTFFPIVATCLPRYQVKRVGLVQSGHHHHHHHHHFIECSLFCSWYSCKIPHVVLFGLWSFFFPKDLKSIWLSNLSILRVVDDDYSRKTSCALNWVSTFAPINNNHSFCHLYCVYFALYGTDIVKSSKTYPDVAITVYYVYISIPFVCR